MPSPIGHTLAGLCGFTLMSPSVSKSQRLYLLLGSVIVSNAPDLDTLPGLFLAGDPRTYHRLAAHSLTAAVIAGVIMLFLARRWKLKYPVYWGCWAAGLYVSHVLLDMLVADGRAPYGVQLLWPFSQGSFIAPFTPFSGFDYFDPGGNIISTIFSLPNLQAAIWETILITPFVLLSQYFLKTRWRSQLRRKE